MKFYLYIIFLFTALPLAAEEPKKTVCLNMIVKNESKVIKRCLATVKPLINYWVIVDTGSSDGTQEMIKEFMKDIPGELHERPWKNFGHNRNEALQLAKGKSDYVLFIDADEVFAYGKDFKLPPLNNDFYYFTTEYGGTSYARVQLINNHLDWKWEGVLHEAVTSPAAKSVSTIEGIKNIVNTDGARSTDPQKYQKDAQILEAALLEEPNNSRYVFYLAQSYRDSQNYKESIKNYEKRIAMGGWDEEVFYSMLQIAVMQEILEMPEETIVDSLYKAYHYRPTRAEPLYRLANYYRRKGDYARGYLISSIGKAVPFPSDVLFVEKWVYDYGIPLEHSICAYWIGKYDECQQTCQAMLANPKLPENIKQCVNGNLAFANRKLLEIQRGKRKPVALTPDVVQAK